MIRTGSLDFALLKPIDTQFLISLNKVSWSSLSNFVVGACLLIFSLVKLTARPVQPLALQPMMFLLYPFYVICGVAILYSLMITLAATSIWLGRNQTLYNFWFYITNFSRYPMEIYSGRFGTPLRLFFTFIIPAIFLMYYPALYFLDKTDPLNPPPIVSFLAPVAGAGTLGVALLFWRFGIKHYQSTGS